MTFQKLAIILQEQMKHSQGLCNLEIISNQNSDYDFIDIILYL